MQITLTPNHKFLLQSQIIRIEKPFNADSGLETSPEINWDEPNWKNIAHILSQLQNKKNHDKKSNQEICILVSDPCDAFIIETWLTKDKVFAAYMVNQELPTVQNGNHRLYKAWCALPDVALPIEVIGSSEPF